MSSCEKCWVDADLVGLPYSVLVVQRTREGKVCTPEQQAGPDAGECHNCKRKTLHQHTGEPMCGCKAQTESGDL